MAKAFVCLFGADSIYLNDVTCKDMVGDLVLEYIVSSACNEGKELAKNMYDTMCAIADCDKQMTYYNLSNFIDGLRNFMKNTKLVARNEIDEYKG